jgi:hypothetical protein
VSELLSGPGAVVAALGAWLLLQRVILPRLGVGT